MAEEMLKVEDINVYYGSIHAIKGVSFSVNKGEIVTLIGANGAGKSTTLNTVSGLLRSKTGSITFNGQDLGKIPPHKIVSMGLAQVPEGRRVFLSMTVQENLEMGAYTQKKGDDIDYVVNSSSSLARPVKPIDGTVFCSPADGFSVFTADKKQLRMSMIDKDGKIIHTITKSK